MAVKVIIKKNSYYDSVTLMSLSGKIQQQEGINEAIVSMATAMNKELLENVGMMTEEVNEASESDLIIAVKAEDESLLEETIELIQEQLTSKKNTKKGGGAKRVKTINAAVAEMPEANMAVISVPGEFAAREARQALEQGMHVMLFSDNVSIEDEKFLKDYASERGLFVMGPDCGTAIINHSGLCFANEVKRGNIGLVGASGTGLQEVTVQINRLGYGISQAIGTGGRDLQESIGGTMMLQGVNALLNDDATNVIVLISKPPAPVVQEKILAVVKESAKPVVVCFIDGEASEAEKAGAVFASTLFEAAKAAVKLSDPEFSIQKETDVRHDKWLLETKAQLAASQQFVRGLFCGGTLTAESLAILRRYTSNLKSNVAKKKEEKLQDPTTSSGNTLLDLGDDVFTVGRPHPMIEPSLRNKRIIQEAADPATAVLLLDFELGYGSHEDPVGETIETIKKAQVLAEKDNRHLPVIAYILGTPLDKQQYEQQERMLSEAGVFVARSNEEATLLAAALIR
ncbi:FdrA family protein [Bacillus sp. FJAT-18017]|uniref:acyl-CoA synthetase FdrA n=1 Tax=Bacillus sp. FJAT-18017 TaxID=1705566 RepID=UPI0006AFF3F9|nr:acyl-CoA synthetase FdrA [Bacillus sp. FJAT-18017]ALC89228.1 FdrA family protein [Bacillus sp. FJAT-18017]